MYTGVTASGNNVTVTATPNTKIGKATNSTALTNALTTHEFQLMTTAQINQTVSAVIRNGVAADAYSSAVSVFDALGGGPISTSDANAIWSDRNSFGGTEAVVTSGTTTFGLYPDSTANITLNIPIGSYELDGFERAIARQAKANATLWAAVTKAQAHGTVLADPDDDTQWEAAVSGKAVDGTVYTMIVRLIGDTEVNRCILQCALGVHVYSGGLLTIVLGFDSTQLGIGTEGPAQITAISPSLTLPACDQSHLFVAWVEPLCPNRPVCEDRSRHGPQLYSQRQFEITSTRCPAERSNMLRIRSVSI